SVSSFARSKTSGRAGYPCRMAGSSGNHPTLCKLHDRPHQNHIRVHRADPRSIQPPEAADPAATSALDTPAGKKAEAIDHRQSPGSTLYLFPPIRSPLRSAGVTGTTASGSASSLGAPETGAVGSSVGVAATWAGRALRWAWFGPGRAAPLSGCSRRRRLNDRLDIVVYHNREPTLSHYSSGAVTSRSGGAASKAANPVTTGMPSASPRRSRLRSWILVTSSLARRRRPARSSQPCSSTVIGIQFSVVSSCRSSAPGVDRAPQPIDEGAYGLIRHPGEDCLRRRPPVLVADQGARLGGVEMLLVTPPRDSLHEPDRPHLPQHLDVVARLNVDPSPGANCLGLMTRPWSVPRIATRSGSPTATRSRWSNPGRRSSFMSRRARWPRDRYRST